MIINRQQVEQHIQWKHQAWNYTLWDSWLWSGPLEQFSSNNNTFNNSTVADFGEEGKWRWSKLIKKAPTSQFPNNIKTKILHNTTFLINQCGNWILTEALVALHHRRKSEKKEPKTTSIHFNGIRTFLFNPLVFMDLRGKHPTNEKLTNFGFEPTVFVIVTRQVWTT